MNRLIALVLAALLAGCNTTTASPLPPAAQTTSPALSSPVAPVTLKNLFYEKELFASALAAPNPYTVAGQLRGGMVPHHLLASDMIAGFFAMAAKQATPYDGVLIVSPSHFPENCGSLATTTTAGWETHLGDILPDTTTIEALLADRTLAAENNGNAVQQDHGVAGLTPFIRHYLPGVPVAVCLLSNKLSETRLAAFHTTIAKLAQERNLLVVASADCSHYLSPKEAALHDTQTMLAIADDNRRTLLSFTDQNIDSPQAVTSFLAAAKAVNGTVTNLGHSSSAEKLPHSLGNGIYRDGVTTYLVYAVTTKTAAPGETME